MILIIAEKDSVARGISQILSGSKMSRNSEGSVRYYEWDNHVCAGLRGHIVRLDFPSEYNSWSRVEPEMLLGVKPVHEVTAKKTVDVLRKLARSADEIIIATDFDREGELIGKEIVDLIGGGANIKRARFSSLVGAEIMEAFENPIELDTDLANAAMARQILDLLWGATLTRVVSLSSNSVGKNFLSVGRVQTPTLAKIVEKDEEIANFVPKEYWVIKGDFRKDGESFGAQMEPIWDGGEAERIFNLVKDEKKAIINNFKESEAEKRRPTPFDTTRFLQCTNFIHTSPSQAMSIAENLYSRGYISYPRTDNTVYPKGLNLKSIVEKLGSRFGDIVQLVLEAGIRPSRGKKESKDHPPIYPTGAVPQRLEKNEDKVYELIVRRFLSTLYKNARIESRSAELLVADQPFRSKGQRVLDKGYLRIWVYEKFEETTLPGLNVGEEIEIGRIDLIKKETKPPSRLAQGSLIVLMEKLGLGTKSTRAEIIKKLYDREYIKGNPPVSTEVATALIKALRKYAEGITKETMTGKLEEEMELIAEGKKSLDEVVEDSKSVLGEVLRTISANGEEMGREIAKAIESRSMVGRCPVCGRDLRTIRSKKGKRFVSCSAYPACKNSYPLPQKGSLKFEESCGECGAPLISLYSNKRRTRGCINPECEKSIFKGWKKA